MGLSDENYDDVEPTEGAAHAQQSENALDQYDDYGPRPSPHRYDDEGQVDLSAPIDFSQQQEAAANDYADEEDYHEHPEDYDVEDNYEQQGEEYYDNVQYHEQPMATDEWGEGEHVGQYDYQGGGDGYDEAPPDVAESDVSSKEGAGDDGGDAMSETSSQKFIETAKRMAAAEQNDPQSMVENDTIEDMSRGEEAHSQARAYRHRAQAERIGRKSRVSEMINQFESS